MKDMTEKQWITVLRRYQPSATDEQLKESAKAIMRTMTPQKAATILLEQRLAKSKERAKELSRTVPQGTKVLTRGARN